MREPINPIKVVKDKKEYSPNLCYELSKPFYLICTQVHLKIEEGEEPIYFKRKQIKNILNLKTGKMESKLHKIKYRIGKKTKDGQEFIYWVNKKGIIMKEEENAR